MSGGSSVPTFADERLAAHVRAAGLVGLPWSERLRYVRVDRAYGHPSFIELAIGLARDWTIPPPGREEWAQLAVEAVRQGSSQRAEELEPFAWAALGYAHRVQGRLKASRAAFLRCNALRDRISDPLELAETCYLESAYWGAVGYWCEQAARVRGLRKSENEAVGKAASLIGDALRLAKPSAPDSVLGLYEIQAGVIANKARHWPVATNLLLSAAERVDPATHPRLAVAVGINLARTAIGLGHLDSAMNGVDRLRSRFDLSEDPKSLLHCHWNLASIAKARGHISEAESRLITVRRRFYEQRMLYEAASVDLELADLAAERGRWPASDRLAARASRTLSALGSPYASEVAARLAQHKRDQ